VKYISEKDSECDYMIFSAKGSLIVCFGGASVDQWLTSFDVATQLLTLNRCKDISANRSVWKEVAKAKNLKGKLSSLLAENSVPTHRTRIVFTGHAFGGAVATLAALQFWDSTQAADDCDLHVITFGAPSVLDCPTEPEGAVCKFLGRCRNYVNGSDLVPRLLQGQPDAANSFFIQANNNVVALGFALTANAQACNLPVDVATRTKMEAESLAVLRNAVLLDESHCEHAWEQTWARSRPWAKASEALRAQHREVELAFDEYGNKLSPLQRVMLLLKMHREQQKLVTLAEDHVKSNKMLDAKQFWEMIREHHVDPSLTALQELHDFLSNNEEVDLEELIRQSKNRRKNSIIAVAVVGVGCCFGAGALAYCAAAAQAAAAAEAAAAAAAAAAAESAVASSWTSWLLSFIYSSSAVVPVAAPVTAAQVSVTAVGATAMGTGASGSGATLAAVRNSCWGPHYSAAKSVVQRSEALVKSAAKHTYAPAGTVVHCTRTKLANGEFEYQVRELQDWESKRTLLQLPVGCPSDSVESVLLDHFESGYRAALGAERLTFFE